MSCLVGVINVESKVLIESCLLFRVGKIFRIIHKAAKRTTILLVSHVLKGPVSQRREGGRDPLSSFLPSSPRRSNFSVIERGSKRASDGVDETRDGKRQSNANNNGGASERVDDGSSLQLIFQRGFHRRRPPTLFYEELRPIKLRLIASPKSYCFFTTTVVFGHFGYCTHPFASGRPQRTRTPRARSWIAIVVL